MMHEWWTVWGRMHWNGVWLDPLLALLLVAALVVGIVAVVRRLSRRGGGERPAAQPLATGEPDKGEYEKRHRSAEA